VFAKKSDGDRVVVSNTKYASPPGSRDGSVSVPSSTTSAEIVWSDDDHIVVALPALDDDAEVEDVANGIRGVIFSLASDHRPDGSDDDRMRRKENKGSTTRERAETVIVGLEMFERELVKEDDAVVASLPARMKEALKEAHDTAGRLLSVLKDKPQGSLRDDDGDGDGDGDDGVAGLLSALEMKLDAWTNALDLAIVSAAIDSVDLPKFTKKPTETATSLRAHLDQAERDAVASDGKCQGCLEDSLVDERWERMRAALRAHEKVKERAREEAQEQSLLNLAEQFERVAAHRSTDAFTGTASRPRPLVGGRAAEGNRARENMPREERTPVLSLADPRTFPDDDEFHEGFTPDDLTSDDEDDPQGQEENDAKQISPKQPEESREPIDDAEAERLRDDANDDEMKKANQAWREKSKRIRADIDAYANNALVRADDGEQRALFDAAMKDLREFVEKTMKEDDSVWTSKYGSGKLREDEMNTIQTKFDEIKMNHKEQPAKEISAGGWGAVHFVASGLDSALGLGNKPSESSSEGATPAPLSSGPNSDLMWLNM
tara:strand:- start:85 stop:1728 length:1644 start_codon:yes stop_codon:yes gene_type:complete